MAVKKKKEEGAKEPRRGVMPTEVLWNYLDWNGHDPIRRVIKERVRSRGYDHEIMRQPDKSDKSKQKARLAGQRLLERWETFYPAQPDVGCDFHDRLIL